MGTVICIKCKNVLNINGQCNCMARPIQLNSELQNSPEWVKCPNCGGIGWMSKEYRCPTCIGFGIINKITGLSPGMKTME
jgi:DnaJ-class molecular chaperone